MNIEMKRMGLKFRRRGRKPLFSVAMRVLATTCIGVLTSCASGTSQGQEGGASVRLGQVFSSVVSERGVAIERNIVFGPSPRHRLDIYRPSRQVDRGPIAIFYYGGGWTSGDRSMYGFVGAALAARGITTVIPNYRHYPDVRFPAFVEDAALAYAHVSQTLAGDCGQQRPIIVIGHSAGAHMAALLALDPTYLQQIDRALPRPAALVSLAGPLSFDPTIWPSTTAIFSNAARNPKQARPSSVARAGAPPALLLHGSMDTTVDIKNSRETAAALRSLGNAVQTIEYPGLGHVGILLAIARPLRWRGNVLGDIATFTTRHFEKEPGSAKDQCAVGQAA